MTYGDVLAHVIADSGMTRAEVARRAGIGRSQITDLTNGRIMEPSISKAKAIADALGVTVQYFIDLMELDEWPFPED